ncbi:MAG: hypothetical protein ACM3X7_14040 [Solirubrobacterales bacterium]
MNINSTANLYLKDVSILKKYGDRYKLTLVRTMRQKGVEINKKRVMGVNDDKLDNNISRAKQRIFEYSMCNDFEYFITLTISPDKYDRTNLQNYYKHFRTFIKNYNRLKNTKIEYVFIPEMHKDGCWHLHGLIKGILKDDIFINENGYLDWRSYKERFGWVSMSVIRNRHKTSSYMTKYVSKSMSKTVAELGAHTYYASKGLKVAEIMKKGSLLELPNEYDFSNDYVKIKWFDDDSISCLIQELNR